MLTDRQRFVDRVERGRYTHLMKSYDTRSLLDAACVFWNTWHTYAWLQIASWLWKKLEGEPWPLDAPPLGATDRPPHPAEWNLLTQHVESRGKSPLELALRISMPSVTLNSLKDLIGLQPPKVKLRRDPINIAKMRELLVRSN